eukprot:CAMPEP_0178910322 /NCGR_PEP_ID=MMETSP0786-20121207/9034_1 /TAXON_ID=186022 /ORGANISM="Thalassionema frauenfeldii, Strain CCMP 1798" /LENGTH=604 /DNA_ID=CAMNT_0020582563 /DNA_START=253 /DNA_END=2067 /DNA_ORIENTATION=-
MTNEATVISYETIKISNLSKEPQKHSKTKNDEKPALSRNQSADGNKKSGWEKLLKRFGGVKKGIVYDESVGRSIGISQIAEMSSSRSTSETSYGQGKGFQERIQSETQEEEVQDDAAIRGRLDGLDTLSLGPARIPSLPLSRSLKKADLLVETMNPKATPAKMIIDMLKASAGRETPEIVLEGFYSGCKGRWSVQMDQKIDSSLHDRIAFLSKDQKNLSPKDSSPVGCSVENLMENMWGQQDTPPTHQLPQYANEHGEEDILSLASKCSVPIDIDEDTFIVETAEHLQSVHEIASVPLRRGDFDYARLVFEKILKGLNLRHEGQPHHLVGSTLHNIGVIQMWQGNFNEAYETFHEAVKIRKASLHAEHEDVGVSLVRLGMASLAILKTADAIKFFQKSLSSFLRNNASRAKILNNLSVAHFLQKDFKSAMAGFEVALEIQRNWFEGKVRRESIIFDGSITLSNMGKIHLQQENFKSSFYLYEEALLLQTTVFRQSCPIVLENLGNIAYVKAKSGDVQKAVSIYNGILRSQSSSHGKGSREYCETMGLLGYLYVQINENARAEACFSSALEWEETHLGANHPGVGELKLSLLNAQSNIAPDSLWA